MLKQAARVVSTEILESSNAKWLKLIKINYEDQNGKLRTWEAMRRPTRPGHCPVDATQLVAVLSRPTGPEILLEKQFRPPIDKVCIEFPAGLVDPGETPEESAVRELLEETGYVGEVVPDRAGGPRPILYSAPASSASSTYMIHVKIDLEKAENKTPKPQLEEGEFIECFTVPLKDLYNECRKLEAQGYGIDGKVGAFAEGIESAREWQL